MNDGQIIAAMVRFGIISSSVGVRDFENRKKNVKNKNRLILVHRKPENFRGCNIFAIFAAAIDRESLIKKI